MNAMTVSSEDEPRKLTKRQVSLLVSLIVAILYYPVVLDDVITFHRIKSGEYNTPWYDNRPWAQPYTHLQLAMQPSTIRHTTNYIQTERWVVKETKLNDKTYWTTLSRTPIEAKKNPPN